MYVNGYCRCFMRGDVTIFMRYQIKYTYKYSTVHAPKLYLKRSPRKLPRSDVENTIVFFTDLFVSIKYEQITNLKGID